MAKDRNGPKISLQVLMIPATDASVDTGSYHEYGEQRFLARAFMATTTDIIDFLWRHVCNVPVGRKAQIGLSVGRVF